MKLILEIINEKFVEILSKEHVDKPGFSVLGMIKILRLHNIWDARFSLLSVVNYLEQNEVATEVYFPFLYDTDCKSVTKLCRLLEHHPTIMKLSIGRKWILSKKHLSLSSSSGLSLCSKGFVHLVNFIDKVNLLKLILVDSSKTFKDCPECDGSGLTARNMLVTIIKESQKLHTLNLKDCRLPVDTMDTIVSIRKSTLKSVSLQGNSSLGDSCFEEVLEMLEKGKNIKYCGAILDVQKSHLHMTLTSGSVSTLILDQLYKAITRTHKFSLQTLSIANLSENLVNSVCQIVSDSKTLLTLEANIAKRLKTKELIMFIQTIKENRTLKELSVFCFPPRNRYYGGVAAAFSSMIEENGTICTLRTSELLIDGEYELFARGLVRNSVLRKLIIADSTTVSELRSWIDRLMREENTLVHPNYNLRIQVSNVSCSN